MKKCSKCGQEKEETEFRKNRNVCKDCEKQYNKTYWKENKDKLSEQKKEYRKENSEKIKEKTNEYYKNNSEKLKEKTKEYRKNNSEKIKEYRENNSEKLKEKTKEYRKNNSEKIKEYRENNPEYMKEYHKNRRHNDPKYRFVCNLRTQICNTFKVYSKNGKTQSCAKYGIDFEAIFNRIGPRPADNFHLDHVLPLSVFDFDNPEHIKLANSPENLRWISAEENLSKSNSIDVEYIGCRLSLLAIAKRINLAPFYPKD